MLIYDVVIVGAGMMAALKASEENGLKVAVLSKVFPTRSHTGVAQGGMNAAMKNRDDKKFLKHTLIYKNGEKYHLDYLPVTITKYQPGSVTINGAYLL